MRKFPTATVLKSSRLCSEKVLYDFGIAVNISTEVCCRKKETPSALMSGAILGARRKGRYAKRSITTPSNPQPTMAAENMRKKRTASGTDGDAEPPNAVSTKYPM